MLCSLLLISWLPLVAEQSLWSSYQLDNGIRVIQITCDDAPKQTVFTNLALGLLDDEAAHAQMSHLVEHMLIRAHDAELFAEGIQMNGETTHTGMRLETFCDPARWKEGLERHARWIRTREVDAAILEREKGHVQQEIDHTLIGKYTHKWAACAWNQVVRHGQSHAAVRGDVQTIGEEALEDYMDVHLALDESVFVVSIGPIGAEEVRKAIESSLGGLARIERQQPEPVADDRKIHDRGSWTATWDLEARHYLEWYPLPAETPDQRAAALILQMMLQMKMMTHPAIQELGIVAFPQADVRTPEGQYLFLSASLPDGVEPREVQEATRDLIGTVLDSTPQIPSPTMLAQNYAMQIKQLEDLSALRKMMGERANDLLEARMALQVVSMQASTGMEMQELAKVLGKLTESVFVDLVEGLSEEKRSSLLLEPQ